MIYNQTCYTRKKQRRLRDKKLGKIVLTLNLKPFQDAMKKVVEAFKNFEIWANNTAKQIANQYRKLKRVLKTRLIKPYLGNTGNPYFYKTTLELGRL